MRRKENGSGRTSLKIGGLIKLEALITKSISSSGDGQLVSLTDYRSSKNKSMEEWLSRMAVKQYGEEKVEACMENPYLRLLIKYDSLSGKAQESMFGYAERVMAECRGKRISKRNIFTEILCLGDFETWEKIEEFTDMLLWKKEVIVRQKELEDI